MGYLQDRSPHFTKVNEYDNINFDRKVVKHENGEEDSKELVINSEKEAINKKAQCKTKIDAALALLLAAILSSPTFASVLVFRLSAAVPRFSTAMPGLSIAVPKSFATMLRSSASVFESFIALLGLAIAVLRSSALVSTSIFVPGLSPLVPIFISALVFPGSSPLLFPALFLPKIQTLDLDAGREKLDNNISGWSGRSKKATSKQLWCGRIKRAALEEALLSRALLFLSLFLSSNIGKNNKTFINTWPLADNHIKEDINLSFARCGYLPTIKLNKPWEIKLLE